MHRSDLIARGENKKVIGTTEILYNGIKFKSLLECNCFKLLEKSGLEFTHEAEVIHLWVGFKPTVQIWAPSKEKINGKPHLTKFMELQTKKIMDITYKPDFKIVKGNYIIYADSKGNPNDVYPYKKKMFIKTLEERNDGHQYLFMEPHNLRQMQQLINIIKNLDNE